MARVSAQLVGKTKVEAAYSARVRCAAEPINYLATIDNQTVLIQEVPKTKLANILLVAKTKLVAALEMPGRVFRNIVEDVTSVIETIEQWFNKTLDTDLVEVQDLVQNTLGKNLELDVIAIQDQVVVFFERNVLLQDYQPVQEQTQWSFTKITDADYGYISDSIFLQTTYTRSFTDLVASTDDINGAAVDDDQTAVLFKVTQDYGKAVDFQTFTTSKGLEDFGLVATQGALFVQNYAQQYYFAENYVGTSRTFT